MASAKLQMQAPESRISAPLVAALDVGVAKTVCLAARRDPVLDMHPERPVRVLGIGQQTAPAIASGKPADFDTCARAIQVAIEEAANMAGAPIKRVVASYSGPGIGARVVRGVARVRGKIITERDIDAVVQAAMQATPTPRLSFLHLEPLRYVIDGGEPVIDPRGQAGKMLSLEACAVTAPTEALEALRCCIGLAGAEVEDIIAGPKAAGLAVLTPEERASGAVLLDLGAGSIGLAVIAGENLLHAETIAAGGVRLTRDLAHKLQTSFAAAERVKLAFGAVGGNFDRREAVQAPKLGGDGRLEAATTLRGVIADTLTPRLQEMLLQARERLESAGFGGDAGPGRVVLVGGGAMIGGVREVAARALGMPVRIGRPFELCGFDHCDVGPAYATLDDVDEVFQPSLAHAAAAMRQGAGRAWDWLRENF
jgi:cell division protein FtsA